MVCSKCGIVGEIGETFYKSQYNRKTNLCKKCSCLSVCENNILIKMELVKYKGYKCSICSYDKNLAALDFHHIEEKNERISKMIKGKKSLDDMKQEVDKCILVCSNCHREIHNPNYIMDYQFQLGNTIRTKRVDKLNTPNVCQNKECGKIFYRTGKGNRPAKFCSKKCSQKSREKIVWPKEDELLLMIKTMSLSEIGRILGVSGNSVKTRAIKYGFNIKNGRLLEWEET